MAFYDGYPMLKSYYLVRFGAINININYLKTIYKHKIFKYFIPNKAIKYDYKYPNWMNPKIISSLRNRSKLTKRYYSIPIEENKNLLTAKSKAFSKMIVDAKERYTNKLSKKLDDPPTMPKAYWSILNNS